MRLLELELKDWCQHQNTHIVFPDEPIIQICGRNNVGKSNLVKAIGRVLGQGKSDFGGGIRWGAKNAFIRLKAITHENTVFTLTRTIGRQSKVTLDFEDKHLEKSDEIQAQLQSWFGRQETLLQVFIAKQAHISSLLQERGKDRLTHFIEICGFKGFLQKQARLNKFIKRFSTLTDPSPLLQDIATRLDHGTLAHQAKLNELTLHPPKLQVAHTIQELEACRTLYQSARQTLDAKTRELATKEDGLKEPLPDLPRLQQEINQKQGEVERLKPLATYQLQRAVVEQTQKELQEVEKKLSSIPVDTTDFGARIQALSQELQKAIARKGELQNAAQEVAQLKQQLLEAEQQQKEKQATLEKLTYSLRWQVVPLPELAQLQQKVFRHQALKHDAAKAQETVRSLQNVPAPSAEELEARKASKEQLSRLQSLHVHAQDEGEQCPLCQQLWAAKDRASRVSGLGAEILQVQAALAKATQANEAYHKWEQAQAELPPCQERATAKAAEAEKAGQELRDWLRQWELNETELSQLETIITSYHTVAEAQKPLKVDLAALRTLHITKQEQVFAHEAEGKTLQQKISQLNSEMAATLQQQTVATHQATERAKLQQAKNDMTARLESEKAKKGDEPHGFDPSVAYPQAQKDAESALAAAQREFQKASQEIATRFNLTREVEGIRAAIQNAKRTMEQQAWSDEKAEKLQQAQHQLETIQRLETEAQVIQSQNTKLLKQQKEVQAQKDAFDTQARDIADMTAVSDFLSYDKGPQKFLTSFFQEILDQTNVLISEMGIRVKLQVGEDLEIMVEDEKGQISSALDLGGGFSNLAGIAFRIALQKMILPRVHVLIFDEPSTHVDENNMQLLIPFFERLKQNLSSYGIHQCIIIDHHPDWRNSEVGMIHIGTANND